MSLYVVATPIGNLNDITKRALQTLFSSDVIACEDTRVTLGLINHFKEGGGRVPELLSFYEENENQRTPEILKLLLQGKKVSLVTNAGTPTISDPGYKLVRECRRQNIEVIAIPGVSSPIAALSSSGLPTDKFIFWGFLPKKSSQRIKNLKILCETLSKIPQTVIIFESPFRVKKTLSDLRDIFGDIPVVVFREITKVHEEYKRGKISELISSLPEKGEMTLLFHPKEG